MKKSGLFIASFALCVATSANAQWHKSAPALALYEKAKAEKKVVVWGTQRTEVEWIPAAFNALFPGIEVEFLGDNDIATKAIAEARAGRHSIDVFWSSLTGVLPLMQRDLMGKPDWSPFGVARQDIVYDGRMAYTSNSAYAIAWNRDLMKREEIPANWAGLLDPKFKSKMVASLFLLPRLLGGLQMAWGQERAVKFARDIMDKSDIQLTRAPRESIVATGERVLAVGEIDSLARVWDRAGMKIDYAVPEPMVLGQFGATVMARAPNPNAALLLAGYMASAEGKAAKEKATLQGDYGPAGASEIARRVHSGKAEVAFDTPQLMEAREKAIREMAPIVTGQK